MNLPNKLTVVRIALVPFFLIALLSGVLEPPLNKYVALAIFTVAALTDALDGYIARKWNLITTFGKFIDPVADKMLVTAAVVAMVQLSLLPAWAVVIFICREFVVLGLRVIAAEQGLVLSAGTSGKIKMIIQSVMIIFLLLGLTGDIAEIIGQALIWLSVILSVYSGGQYVFENRKLFKGSM
ncbi:MAG: CDP-diacylglycerol--glycerol-3-phosphate 3-phosphatidyltransferase [Defluviitaleaceae bacterium]|nr:CDP-diacylglycerol--glycerol-3-phosphate 3-phosphatidyltransferase [Defluviitaleaceae bacterium]